MGVKLLSIQMFPWCFHLMGGGTTSHDDADVAPSTTLTAGKASKFATGGAGAPSPFPGSIKLITTDGKVEVYHRPVSASELMSEHPRHLICRSDAPFTIGQMIPSLPEGEQLQPGYAYFLLPVHVFHSVLSFVTLASSFARAAAAAAANGGVGSPPSALLQKPPFDVEKTPSGKLQIRVSEAFIERIREAHDGGDSDGGVGGGRVCITAALEKDYRCTRSPSPSIAAAGEPAAPSVPAAGEPAANDRIVRRARGRQDRFPRRAGEKGETA